LLHKELININPTLNSSLNRYEPSIVKAG